jgi:hypothetical protein
MFKCKIFIVAILINMVTNAQNKSGNMILFGGGGMYMQFNDTSKPITGQLFPSAQSFWMSDGQSNICDSATGRLKIICNGYTLFDSMKNIIENGDSLQPDKIYQYDCCPAISLNTQGSLILPKGSNGLYYVFTPTITDTTFDKIFSGQRNNYSYDLLQYHVVDMNANNGAGKVIQKNVEMVSNVELSKVGMQAVRHANGYDWWLLKQGADTNIVYTFLVTKDSVILDTIQGFNTPKFGYFDLGGQSCFSADGSKYAYVQIKSTHLFMADFDRCYGILSNPQTYNIPYDSSTIVNPSPQYIIDSARNGICFSPNDKFIYITGRFNIYQFEYNEPDSALAWYRVQHGFDTTYNQFEYYGQLSRGIDSRIYIGKWSGTSKQNSVINKPNEKGSACEFCRKCLRYDFGNYSSVSPANIADFNLEALPYSCPPLNTEQWAVSSEQLAIYPNPSSTIFYIKNKKGKKKELYNSVGELILSTTKDEVNVSYFSIGVYYLKCENVVKKVIVE